MEKYKVKYPSSFGYTCEITDFLYDLRKDKGDKKYSDFYVPYFLGPEDLTDEEKKKYNEPVKLAIFRCVGYSVGYLVFNKNFEIIDIIVYDRPKANVFVCSCKELNEKLKVFIRTVFDPQQ